LNENEALRDILFSGKYCYSVCFLSILLTTHEHIFPRISVDKQQQQTDNMSFGEKKKKKTAPRYSLPVMTLLWIHHLCILKPAVRRNLGGNRLKAALKYHRAVLICISTCKPHGGFLGLRLMPLFALSILVVTDYP